MRPFEVKKKSTLSVFKLSIFLINLLIGTDKLLKFEIDHLSVSVSTLPEPVYININLISLFFFPFQTGHILHLSTNRCLDLNEDGKVILNKCINTPSQMWSFLRLEKPQKKWKKTTKYKNKNRKQKNELFDIRNLIISLNLLPYKSLSFDS